VKLHDTMPVEPGAIATAPVIVLVVVAEPHSTFIEALSIWNVLPPVFFRLN